MEKCIIPYMPPDQEPQRKPLGPINIRRDRFSDGRPVWVAKHHDTGVVSQGSNRDEAKQNLRDAVDLYNEVTSGITSDPTNK